jgi:hypothetical protein
LSWSGIENPHAVELTILKWAICEDKVIRMAKPFRNWGGESTDAQFVELKRVLGAYPAGLKTIVNVIMLVHNKSTGEPGINAFNGGHLRLNDESKLYSSVKRYVDGGGTIAYMYGGNYVRGGTRKWSQSHPTLATPYEITMPSYWLSGWGCLLFGTHDGGSWFQSEATSVKRGYGSMAYHTAKDFAAYKMSGLQQGAIGTSTKSDKDPIVADTSVSNEVLNFFHSELP